MAKKGSWLPVVAGILCIIAGALELLSGLGLSVVGSLLTMFIWMPELGALVGVPLIILGILAIIGGICSLSRRAWGMALTGAICSIFLPHSIIFGILAIIFLALSKQEFK